MNRMLTVADVSTSTGLNEVSPEVSAYLRASLSDNSRRAYVSDLNQFVNWGGTIPATPETLAHYLAAHAGQLSVATLARRLVSIGKAHAAQALPSPTTTEIVKSTLKGIRRTHGSAQRQVVPTLKDDVLAMVAGLSSIKGARDKALLLIGFAGAFRRSELVSLQFDDIEHATQGIIINLRHSKTDQQQRGRKVAIPYARGSVCPCLALHAWMELAGITEGPLFRGVSRHGMISDAAVTPQVVANVVKERALAVGLDPSKFAGHSLRAGLVTSAATAGVSSWKIRQQSGHRSDAMLTRYIRDSQIFIDNAAGALL